MQRVLLFNIIRTIQNAQSLHTGSLLTISSSYESHVTNVECVCTCVCVCVCGGGGGLEHCLRTVSGKDCVLNKLHAVESL